MVKAAVHHEKPKKDESKKAQEVRIKSACAWLREDPTRKIAAAAREFLVTYDTLRHRYLGHHRPARQSQEHRQTLTHSEEQVLVDWIEHRSAITSNGTISSSSSSVQSQQPVANFSSIQPSHFTVNSIDYIHS